MRCSLAAVWPAHRVPILKTPKPLPPFWRRKHASALCHAPSCLVRRRALNYASECRQPTLYRSLADLPAEAQGAVLAIGNFDGVHIGHQQVIGDARALAEAKTPLGVMLFDPIRSNFSPRRAALSPDAAGDRAALLAELGVDFTLALPFDAAMAGCEAEDFITDILVGKLNVSAVCVGYDFCFGKGRKGNFAMLRDVGGEMGFETFATEAVLQPDSTHPFSSSAIRNFLRDGEPKKPPL